MRRGALFIVYLSVFLLAACGGSSKSTTSTQKQMTAAQYRARIAAIKLEAGEAQKAVGKGLQAKTVNELKQRVDTFAAATQRIGDEVAALNPPLDAQPANRTLAKGLHEIAAGTRAASAKIAGMKTVQQAITYLRTAKGPVQGSRDVSQAIAELQKLGFTSPN